MSRAARSEPRPGLFSRQFPVVPKTDYQLTGWDVLLDVGK
jgi:hypothetical protein